MGVQLIRGEIHVLATCIVKCTIHSTYNWNPKIMADLCQRKPYIKMRQSFQNNSQPRLILTSLFSIGAFSLLLEVP